MKCTVAAVCRMVAPMALGALVMALVAPARVEAANVSWGPVFVVDDPTDISRPAGSLVHAALDFNTVAGAGTAGGDNMINGIPFTQVTLQSPGVVSTTFANSASYNATYHPGGTGDQDLDDLLDSHAYSAGNPGTTSITAEGLAVGGVYRVQLINVADSRACCATRTYEPDNGAGSFTTGVTMQRSLFQSTIGSFTANAATQTIQLRSLNAAAGNNDPGLSGLVVLRVPEPTGLALAGLGASLLVAAVRQARRRKSVA
jgi:hypothetical protein